MLAAGRPIPVDQLVERTRVRRHELLTFLQRHPHLMETTLGWVDALQLADGVAFVHELNAAERDADVLAGDDDLALLAVLAQEGLPLAGGGEVRALPLPEQPSGVRTNVPAGCGLIGQGLVGPPGWLAGFQAGDLLLVQLHGGALAVRTTEPPHYRTERVAAFLAACTTALEQSLRRYREGDADNPTVDIAAVVTELLATQPEVLADPLPPLRPLVEPIGWETFGGQIGFAGTAWNSTPIRHLSRLDAITAMQVLGAMLRWDEKHPDGDQTIEMLKRLVKPEILGYLADEVERRTATVGTSFTAVLDRLASAAITSTERAATALLAARAAEGAGDSRTAQRLVKEALAEQADLQPALLDAAEYAACQGVLREAIDYLRRVDHPIADPLRDAVRSVLDSLAGGGQPGRNHPCPCGSGRKYKVCCQASAVAPLSARSGLLYTLLATFAQRMGSGEMLGILINRCGGNPQAVFLCVDLLLTHGDAHERFLRARGHWLRDDERRLVEGWATIPIGAFEVREIRYGSGVTVRALPSDESIVLRDRKFSTSVRRLDLLCGRILNDGAHPQLLALPALVNRDRRRDLLDLLACGPSAEQIAEFFGPQPDPYLINSDGHDHVDVELTLQVPDDSEVAWHRLSARLVRTDHHALEHHDERRGKVVSLGRITRSGQRWTLTANSLERLAALESLVRAELPAAREVSRRADRLGAEPPSDGRKVRTLEVDSYVVPADTCTDEQAEEHLLRTTRESWVDTPNRLGMTPREAAKVGGDVRRELEAILDDMQWYNDRNRDQGKSPTMDVAWIRKELGVPA